MLLRIEDSLVKKMMNYSNQLESCDEIPMVSNGGTGVSSHWVPQHPMVYPFKANLCQKEGNIVRNSPILASICPTGSFWRRTIPMYHTIQRASAGRGFTDAHNTLVVPLQKNFE